MSQRVVYELKNTGMLEGLYTTLEGAQAAAQKRLEEYHELHAGLSPADRQDVEPLITTQLEWSVQRLDHRGLVVPDGARLGWETLVARYTENNGYFTVHEREVGP